MSEITPAVFWSRLRALHRMFKERHDNPASAFFGVDALVVWIGKAAETAGPEVRAPFVLFCRVARSSELTSPSGQLEAYQKSTVLSIHLLDGYEFPDTLFYMTDKTATFVCSEKKVRLIQACKDKKPKGDTDDWTLDLVARGKQVDEWQTIARSALRAPGRVAHTHA